MICLKHACIIVALDLEGPSAVSVEFSMVAVLYQAQVIFKNFEGEHTRVVVWLCKVLQPKAFSYWQIFLTR